MLSREARAGLRSLSKEHANRVAEHLAAAEMLLDGEPEQAYAHAMAAQRSAGRIDVVREAVAIAAYQTARYPDALREARTVRRLSGSEHLRPIEADAERGMGRPDRALAVISEVKESALTAQLRVELGIVASGARADLGEFDAGLLVVEELLDVIRDKDLRSRLLAVKADRLDDLGRTDEAEALRSALESEQAQQEAESESVLYIDETIDPDVPEKTESEAPEPDDDDEPESDSETDAAFESDDEFSDDVVAETNEILAEIEAEVEVPVVEIHEGESEERESDEDDADEPDDEPSDDDSNDDVDDVFVDVGDDLDDDYDGDEHPLDRTSGEESEPRDD